jgi:hypothetical protein
MAWMMLWMLVGGTLVLLLVMSLIALRRSRRLDRRPS